MVQWHLWNTKPGDFSVMEGVYAVQVCVWMHVTGTHNMNMHVSTCTRQNIFCEPNYSCAYVLSVFELKPSQPGLSLHLGLVHQCWACGWLELSGKIFGMEHCAASAGGVSALKTARWSGQVRILTEAAKLFIFFMFASLLWLSVHVTWKTKRQWRVSKECEKYAVHI